MWTGRSYYDLANNLDDPFPGYFYLEYLNNATVQEAIGVPINYTQSNTGVYTAFDQSKFAYPAHRSLTSSNSH